MDLKSAGECIKRNREQKSISLVELTERTGIDILKLQEFENGQYKPKASELKKISKELGVPLIAVMHGGGVLPYVNEEGKISYKQY